jgi:lipopolysaccharide biosynthesis glycosyltransferase
MSKCKLKVGQLCKVCTSTHFDDKVVIRDLKDGYNIDVEVLESYHGLKRGDKMVVYRYSLKPLFPKKDV